MLNFDPTKEMYWVGAKELDERFKRTHRPRNPLRLIIKDMFCKFQNEKNWFLSSFLSEKLLGFYRGKSCGNSPKFSLQRKKSRFNPHLSSQKFSTSKKLKKRGTYVTNSALKFPLKKRKNHKHTIISFV